MKKVDDLSTAEYLRIKRRMVNRLIKIGPTRLKELSRSLNIGQKILHDIADEADDLVVNIGIGVNGGYWVYETIGEYIIEAADEWAATPHATRRQT